MAGDAGGGGGGISGGRARSGRKTARLRKAGSGIGGGLMLASMLDILMAILFFLLKNYSTIVSDFNIGKDISLPMSSAQIPPQAALQLIVTKNAIILDEKTVATIVNGEIAKEDLYRDGITIVRLAQALKAQKDRSLYIAQRNDEHSFTGSIVMQADKNLKFHVMKKILYTTGVLDFNNLKLAVLKKDST